MLAWVRSNVEDMQDTLIVWDIFAAHRNDRVLSFLRNSKIHTAFIPPGCTGVCQVMDCVVNRPLKCAIRSAYIAWRAAQIANNLPFASPTRRVRPFLMLQFHGGETCLYFQKITPT